MDVLAELRTRIHTLAAGSPHPLRDNGFIVASTPEATEPLGTVAEPAFALVVQGAKRSTLAEHVFEYHAGEYLVVTVDLPLVSQVTEATATQPFLGFGLPLDARTIAQLLLDAGPGHPTPSDGIAIAVNTAGQALLDAVLRLLRLTDSPQDLRVLGPAIRREIHWRLMTGPQAGLVRQIGLADSRLTTIAQAIRWIQHRFDQVLRVDDLAEAIGLSVSTLNRNFRAVTAMSPVQYQKHLRLQKARLQLLTAGGEVAAVGHSVGYDSASQFSREYRRMFGAPPGQDVTRLRGLATVVE
ncbi:AraC family transcriptional regulator [Crossiella cryophila]|uniref:AraC-like DNA-binding protein n=1 Tax=Crossiella cryophila TaxID=43355 RepID=A0A7W7CBT6_9PSEU|nr:AraC family transcriptional regulator [Crossiella cryophila]MBB4678225.1 AraC-like DNA-binding protein [Crossiella cryophila]